MNDEQIKKRSLVPPKNQPENDLIMTPDYLAQQIVDHFLPYGSMLDPFLGKGAFYNAMKRLRLTASKNGHCDFDWCEISKGKDFFEYNMAVNWIVSNPPYSKLLACLEKSFEVADNVVFLIQPPAAFFTAKRNLAIRAGFAISGICYVDTPREWVNAKGKPITFGTGLGAVHWQRGWTRGITETDARNFT